MCNCESGLDTQQLDVSMGRLRAPGSTTRDAGLNLKLTISSKSALQKPRVSYASIKTAWEKWVRGTITRQHLLDMVASFVKTSCLEAWHLDVIGDFKVWYERLFELLKQRNAAEAQRLAGNSSYLTGLLERAYRAKQQLRANLR